MKKKIKPLVFIAAVIVLVPIIVGYQNMETQKKDDSGLIRVACIGDSITEGSEYPSYLWMLLGSNYTVGTFGHGGTTVSLGATPYMHEAECQMAKDFQPDIVVIMLGTNDAFPGFQMYKSTFVDDYLKLIAEFEELQSKPQVWLVLPPPVLNNGTGLSTLFFQQNVIPHIEEVAIKTSLPTINLYAALASRPDCFPDGVHPTSEGSKLIANEVYKALISKQIFAH